MISTATSGEPRRRWVHDRFTSSDPKNGLDSYGQARPATDGADSREHAWHEGHAVERIVPDSQGLALTAEQHLLMRDQSAEPDSMDADPVDLSTPGSRQLLDRRIRRCSESGRVACGSNPASRVRRRAGRRINLPRVVQLDDLRALAERGCL